MDGFFVAKLKKFAPGERKMVSTASGVPDKDAPEANEAGGDVDEMDFEDRFVLFLWFPSQRYRSITHCYKSLCYKYKEHLSS